MVARPPSIDGPHPSAVHTPNVTSDIFEIGLQGWEHLDHACVNEGLDYAVMEAGSYVLANGARVEAGKFGTSTTTKAPSPSRSN